MKLETKLILNSKINSKCNMRCWYNARQQVIFYGNLENTLAEDVLLERQQPYQRTGAVLDLNTSTGIKKPIYSLKFTSTNKDASTYATKRAFIQRQSVTLIAKHSHLQVLNSLILANKVRNKQKGRVYHLAHSLSISSLLAYIIFLWTVRSCTTKVHNKTILRTTAIVISI